MILYIGCGSKQHPMTNIHNKNINISKNGNFLFYAYLSDNHITKISKKILTIQKDEEVIRVYTNGYYPIYDIYSKGKICFSKGNSLAENFCNSNYTEADSQIMDTSLNILGSIVGLTLAKGVQYHKVFAPQKFQKAIILSQLPLIKKTILNSSFNILNIDIVNIDIEKNTETNINIVSKPHIDIMFIYDKNNNFKSIVKTYDLKNRDFFEATSILTKRLMESYIQQKTEFETGSEFLERVEKVSSAKSYFIYIAMQSLIGNIKLDKLEYRAEEQLMYAVLKSNHNFRENIKLQIPRDKAISFKNKSYYNPQLTFQYKNNKISLQKIKIDDFFAKKILNHHLLKPIYPKIPKIATRGYIDDIPKVLEQISSKEKDSTKWLFVIGAEEYDNTDSVVYSKRSAEIFIKVAQKSLGITERNSYALIGNRATSGAIEDRLNRMLENVKDGDTIYFYYSGHGIPVLPDRFPYLLPKDKIPDYIGKNSFFKLENIYNLLSNSKATKVIAIMDSCFSGSTDGKSVFKGVAGSVLIPKKVTFDHQKMVVLTAGRDKQFSNMYPKRGHRLFSYFVMKALLEGKRSVRDIYNSVYPNVKSVSNGFGDLKRQEPTIEGNEGLRF